MRVLQRLRPRHFQPSFSFGPFNSSSQRRWKRPVVSAQTRLEDRTRDTQLDKLATQLKKLNTILKLHDLMTSRKRGPFVSVQIMSRWRHLVGINVGIGEFLHKAPHVFDVFTHPVRRNLCCRFTDKMLGLLNEEDNAVKQWEMEAVRRVKRLLMMSVNGTLRVHALRLVRRELGLPEDFRESILSKYSKEFKLVDLEVVELVGDGDEDLCLAEIEKWREKEYIEKWLSEFETKYAFPISFPTGFKIQGGFRDKLKNWQRLPYVKPYERREEVRVRSCGGIERFEKRVVGILHEFLSLTVEKMVEVERLAHFQRDFAMVVNVRELLLKHPGIFYISTKGSTRRVFLREAYCKGYLVEPNPIYEVRRKMLDLILVGCRYTRELGAWDRSKVDNDTVVCEVKSDVKGDGDWVIPMLESLNHESNSDT
ncbi:Plant organelle RNA recognition domain containing protein [Trema orientale]|uniref:Plant organelle RNA recognition domain containing protein n=1 Tax=Trema orientale TaxID=63057 RepID=A0A2P5FBL3_TREOI|nr:Plant organelle RNA recognition domain containing protein [Trema orientale]